MPSRKSQLQMIFVYQYCIIHQYICLILVVFLSVMHLYLLSYVEIQKIDIKLEKKLFEIDILKIYSNHGVISKNVLQMMDYALDIWVNMRTCLIGRVKLIKIMSWVMSIYYYHVLLLNIEYISQIKNQTFYNFN